MSWWSSGRQDPPPAAVSATSSSPPAEQVKHFVTRTKEIEATNVTVGIRSDHMVQLNLEDDGGSTTLTMSTECARFLASALGVVLKAIPTKPEVPSNGDLPGDGQ